MKTTKQFIANPFNLDPHEYDKMYASVPPLALTMPIYIYHEPGAKDRAALRAVDLIQDEIAEAAGRCASGPLLQQVRSLPDDFRFGVGTWQDITWSLFPATANQWAVEGLYVEAGYFNPISANGENVDQRVIDAMMLFDAAVTQSRSLDPKDHSPLDVGSLFASQWSNAVGGLFRKRTGIWCDVLQDHRTLILIICRALIMGRDPVTEYHKFKAAGGTYFLEYPHLCP